MIYLCCDKRRRNAVAGHPALNGIDFLEVLDADAAPGAPRQQTLLVRLLKPVPAGLDAGNVAIDGGERISPVRVEWASPASAPPAALTAAERDHYLALPEADRTLVVRTDSSGDYSPYTLRLSAAAPGAQPPPDFDPLLSRIAFSFKVECPSDFDCLPARVCPEEPLDEPEISYLAKDYASFRRLMLDRMSQLAPAWQDRSPADLGLTLVELLAYVGDHLSYRQDAIATEAYLDTARRRVSMRRHARLIDYEMHDGANARAWVHVEVEGDGVTIERGTTLLTRVPGVPPVLAATAPPSELQQVLRQHPVVFETLHDATFFEDNNDLPFYTWGDEECCLPAGATRATLREHRPHLEAGQVVVFEEVLGARTGRPEDADPSRRHAVRLVEVVGDATDPLDGAPVTEIRWHADDALPFPVCVSARTDPEHGGAVVADVSRAVGNVVLADHGATIAGEALGTVPQPHLFVRGDGTADRCEPRRHEPVPPRFRPRLREGPLTQAAPYDPQDPPPSASGAMRWDLRRVRPRITLHEQGGDDWEPRRDLLGSAAGDAHVVAEVESDGTTQLRFGDDHRGRRPGPGAVFTATYRAGNGTAGNVGADSISHVVTDTAGVVGVRNPLPARGGVEPEAIEQVRQKAPFAFRVQERAVTPADYEAVSKRHPDVQRAAATFRWTGSWHTVFATVDRFGGRRVTEEFEHDLRRHLERFRMAGYDLEVDAPRFVSLELDLFVCAGHDHFRADVKAAVLRTLSTGTLPGGRRGLFHPDNFTFEQPVYLSAVLAAVQAVPGVASVEARTFQRQGVPDPQALDLGVVTLDRLEIARLDNDPNFPEHGVLRVEMGGGK